MLTIIKWGSES